MKKLTLITIIIFALVLAGCNFPGFEGDAAIDPDDAMATEIARILTGTPVQMDVSPTPEVEEPEPTAEVEPTETEEELPEPTEPVDVEEPTATPAPTDTPAPTPTATLADTDPALTLGNPNWVDNMNNDDNWPSGYSDYTTIDFKDGFLRLTAQTDLDGWRVSWPTIDDFYLEATLQTPACEGSDHFGLMFRVPADSQAGRGYLFGITCDGRYGLRRWDGRTMHFLVNLTANDAIKEGSNVVNKLGVMARDSNLALYINGQKVNEVTDSNYLDGKFGFFVGGTNVENLSVWVDQVRYWTEP
ncbi:MAG: hypothetical protein K0B06_06070 [Brevefilum sp.]|nr:hypothetical protein [Brevefilum sp.]